MKQQSALCSDLMFFLVQYRFLKQSSPQWETKSWAFWKKGQIVLCCPLDLFYRCSSVWVSMLMEWNIWVGGHFWHLLVDFFLHGVVRVGGILGLLECCEGMISHLLAESLKWYAVMASVLLGFFSVCYTWYSLNRQCLEKSYLQNHFESLKPFCLLLFKKTN